MQSFSCAVIGEGLLVLQIEYVCPPGRSMRFGKLQVHMAPEQARRLARALLAAIQTIG
jgi:hypothetical protein